MKTYLTVQPGRRVAPLTIAVVDDVAEIQSLVREWLTGEGHVVACADNGLDLARMASTRRFDVVVTDIMMPDSDGFEVISLLKQANPEIRIVAMSGGGSIMSAAGYLAVAKRLGADEVLFKPFRRSDLIEAIARATGSEAAPEPAS